MKKGFILLIIIVSLLSLQALWINNAYQDYVAATMLSVEECIKQSMQKELTLRDHGAYKDPQKPKTVIKYAESMTPEERDKHKGDTLDLEKLSSLHFGENLSDVVTQLRQDGLMDVGKPLDLPRLDSIFQTMLRKENIEARYCILIYDKDTTLNNSIGTLSVQTSGTQVTPMYPIGLKACQLVQVKTEIIPSPFLKRMFFFLSVSVLLVVAVMLCVVQLIITIRRKDALFKRREMNVNGTVHDLKAPLNSIILLMSLIKKRLADENLLKLAESTSLQAQKLVCDIEALLLTARRDRQQIVLQKTDVDLLQLIIQAKESLSPTFTNKNFSFSVECEKKEVVIYADALYVTNVIRNLMENALKYSDDGVWVRICVQQKKNMTLLAVEDNGWGIEQKYQKKIFNQFFQIPTEQAPKQRGYGMGLAYSLYVMQVHGGTITVNSEIKKGSTFTCVFPVK